jgi:rifampicin phosphotransferase
MHDVIPLRELRLGDAGDVGGKAANLGELTAAGLPVPDGFCLPVGVYQTVVAPALARVARDEQAADTADAAGGSLATVAQTLRETVEAVELPDGLLAELEAAYRALCPDGGRVAVRSSGVSEDSAAASFAGQYHTELDVGPGPELAAAVRRCWASVWSAQAVRYRERRGIAHENEAMAVVVQAMVPADAAGIMFTVDPRTAGRDGDAGPLVIESGWGYGEAVVGGLVTPDRFTVSRSTGKVTEAQVADKVRMVAPAATGTREVDVAEDKRALPSLTEEQAAALAELGLAIEAHYGRPQDVEWAIAGGRISILQARPITGPPDPGPAAPEAEWRAPIENTRWARMSICDSWLPQPLSPLFASTLYPRMVEEWLKNWAGPDPGGNPLIPRPMACTINGYAYLRFDYTLNRYPLRTAHLILSWFRFHLARLDKRWRTVVLPRHVERIRALRGLDLAGLDSAALLRRIAEAEQLSGEYWGIIGGLTWYWNLGEYLMSGVYPFAVKRIAGEQIPARAHGGLLQGYPTKTSAAESALYDLARSADEGGLDEGGRDEGGLDTFLAEYGHQVYNLDFAEPTQADERSAIHTVLDSYRTGSAENPRERLRTLAEKRDGLSSRIMAELRGAPARRGALAAALRLSRRAERLRDEALFHFTLGWPFMRQAYLELGRRLVAAGVLAAADDVFFLTGPELEADLLEAGTADPDRAQGAPPGRAEEVAARRALREQQKLLSPPAQVPADTRIYLGRMDITSLALFGRAEAKAEGSGLAGSAVGPGRVTGPARIVLSLQDFPKLRRGDVLVAPYITPAWSSLLALAAGVVTDTGGVLSHGSIVAREYGIPVVMGTGVATKQLQDGQIVTVDGDRGVVS